MIRLGRDKLISYGVDDPRPQLFDVVADPMNATIAV